jgi:ferredoxin
MKELHDKVRQLLESKTINLFIGYQNGIGNKVSACFVSSSEQIEKLIYNEDCLRNLIVYFHKPEIKKFSKIGIMANISTLKAILQLASENQIKDEQLVVLIVTQDGKIVELANFQEIEEFVSVNPQIIAPFVRPKIQELNNLPREEKWNYWVAELSNCIKCYACRAACPMCYCTQCTVESNQPQWIPVASHAQGNLEWQLLRVMHLAGRCINCGECARACPVEIPLGLLTTKMNDDIEAMFGQKSGMKADAKYALSSFKVEDKDNFIR